MGQPLYIRARTALLIFFAASASCASTAPRIAEPIRAAVVLPFLDLQALDGKHRPLSDLSAGRPVLISLWATWCEACAIEYAPLNRLYERTKKEALIVAIAVGQSAQEVSRFAAQTGLRYPIFVDPDFTLATALDSRQVPTTLIVDRTGKIVYRSGLFDGAALAAFRELLEDPRQAD